MRWKATFVSSWYLSEMLKTSSNIYRKEEMFSFICPFSVLQVSSLVLCLVKSLHHKEREFCTIKIDSHP